MSYIRLCVPMRKRKSDKIFDKTSLTYAWNDTNGYIYISNGWARTLSALKKQSGLKGKRELLKIEKAFEKLPHLLQAPQVLLTPAEMRYMCREFLRQDKQQKRLSVKRRTGSSRATKRQLSRK